MNLEKITRIKKRIEDHNRKSEQAEGASIQLKKELLEKFDCKSVREGEKFLKDLKDRIETKQKRLETKYEEFINQHGRELEISS